MNEVLWRRVVELHRDGEIDEYCSFTITNRSNTAFGLDHWLQFIATDSPTNVVVGASDGLGGRPAYEADWLGGRFVVAARALGSLAPNESRTLGAHIRRSDRAWANDHKVSLDDPTFLEDLQALHASTISAEVVLVFPRSETWRSVEAPRARTVTSRTAVWRLPVAREALFQIRAVWQRGAFVPRPVRDYDDRIANEYLGIAKSSATFDPSAADASPAAVAIKSHAKLAEELEAGRVQVVTGGPRCSNTATEALDRIMDEVSTLLAEDGRKEVLDAAFADTLMELLSFAEKQRQSGSQGWPSNVLEKQFQERLYDFLAARGATVLPEAVVGDGRIDFMLSETPIELKARPLGAQRVEQAMQNAQQAAEYAARKGRSVGILMVLDTSRRATDIHGPRFDEDVVVRSIPAKDSLSGRSHTVVVIFLLTAFPTKPSKLRAPRVERHPGPARKNEGRAQRGRARS